MKIFCVAANYPKHNAELNFKKPENPVFFLKPETSYLRNNSDFYIPDFAQNFEYEAEIVVRICKLGKAVPVNFAHKYYDAITVGLDITARDLQKKYMDQGLPWFLSKGFDNAAPVGDFVPLSDFDNIDNINFSLDVNQKRVQTGCTSDMIFKVDEIVSYISQFVTYKTGDLIFTGTPAGVGPLKIGDVCRGFINDKSVLNINVK